MQKTGMSKLPEFIKANENTTQNSDPFFYKKGERKSTVKNSPASPFFSGNNGVPSIQAKPETPDDIIQRQEHPDVTNTTTPGPPVPGSYRAKKCLEHPEFPNFGCFAQELKLDIDENMWNNAHQFSRAAVLYPGNKDMMWDTFLRYGLGVNLLKTSFGFLEAKDTLGTVLSYGAGAGLKSYDLLKNGKLQLDVPIPLGKDLSLDLKLDLNTDPNNLSSVKSLDTSVGISGHF
jgi:hypothetical protein